MVSRKYAGYFLKTLKILLGVALIWLFYHQLQLGNLKSLQAIDRSNSFYILLGLTLLFMPLNWILEAIKWKYMLSDVLSVSRRGALIQVLKGITVGIMTPGRLGDYGGRLIHLDKSNHKHALAATFTGSMAQNIIQFSIGAVCLYFFVNRLELLHFEMIFMPIILLAGMLCMLIALFFYPSQILKWMARIPWLKNYDWLQEMGVSVNYSTTKLFKLLGLAFFRYLTYTIQYILILNALDVEMHLPQMVEAIGVIYFFQSLLPLPPVLNWLGRGEIAVLVLGQFNISAIYALICTYLLWFINLGIPALIGYVLILSGGYHLKHTEIKTNGHA